MKNKISFINCHTLEEIVRGYILYSINREVLDQLRENDIKKILLEDDIYTFKRSSSSLTITRVGV